MADAKYSTSASLCLLSRLGIKLGWRNVYKINLKPLSVNDAWQGKRFKTPAYKSYERSLFLILPRIELPSPPYEVHYEFGFSSPLADWDNPVKPFQDILQNKYRFNDKDIVRAVVTKTRVEKGEEYSAFRIITIDSIL